MTPIDTTKMRGLWQINIIDAAGGYATHTAGDDTVASIKLVADKVNEIVEWINSKESKTV